MRQDFRVSLTVTFRVDVCALNQHAAEESARHITRSVFHQSFSRAEHLIVHDCDGRRLLSANTCQRKGKKTA